MAPVTRAIRYQRLPARVAARTAAIFGPPWALCSEGATLDVNRAVRCGYPVEGVCGAYLRGGLLPCSWRCSGGARLVGRASSIYGLARASSRLGLGLSWW
jgi:hypothetical protein